tara:strand:+ start:2585 stop:3853 length:1269 start_codon:yes stop_codon:yes gene_type:complete
MLKSTLGTFGSKLIGAILNFLVIILLSQFLGPEGKGEASLILTSVAIILVFGNLIGGAPVVYFTPRKSILQLLKISYVWCIIVAVAGYFSMQFFSLGIDEQWITPIALLSLIEGFTAVNLAILIGKEKIGQNNTVGVIKSVSLFATLFYLFQFSNNPTLSDYLVALYISFGLGLVVSTLFLSKVIDHKNPEPPSAIFRAILKNGILNQVAYILQFLSFRIGYYIINKELGEGELGIYSNAISIAESIWLISRSIALVQFSRIVNSDDQISNQVLTVKLFKLTLLLSIMAIFVLNVLPEDFYTFVFGPEFIGIKSIIFWISPGILAFNLFLIFGHYFSGVGQFMTLTIAAFVGFVIAIIGSLILVKTHGTIGIALTTSISLVISTLMAWIQFSRTTKIKLSSFLIQKDDFILFIELVRNIRKN